LTSTGQILTDSAISTADTATLQISGSHIVGTISGSGTTNVIDGDLTANAISQYMVIIGAGATVTMAALPGGPLGLSVNLVPVPEPSALVLLGIGVISLLLLTWRRQK
jgi:hypothetical protein